MANWTVEIDRGRSIARRGGPTNPSATVRAPLHVLNDVVSGKRSGVEAFLNGDLTVRGNLALALQLDGLFPSPDETRPVPHRDALDERGRDRDVLPRGRTADAPPVVLIHGLSATNASMLPLIPQLATEYRVLAPDLPGHGGTEATGDPHAAEFLGNWLIEFLRQTCDQPAVLIGNSLGGRTALEAALNSPYEVRGLVLLCPAVAFRKLRQFVPLVRMVRDEIAALPVKVPRTMVSRVLHSLFYDPGCLPEPWYEAAIDEFTRVLNIRANRLSIFSSLRHIYLDEPFGETGFWERLPNLKPPALFIWGDHDVLVPASFHNFATAALPQAQSVILAECGHVPQFEHPELTGQYAREFIAALPTPSPADHATRG